MTFSGYTATHEASECDSITTAKTSASCRAGVLVNDSNKETDFRLGGRWVLRGRDETGKFVQTRLGRLHNNVTSRTRLKNSHKHNPAYASSSIHPDFLDAQKFCDWVVAQPGWGLGYHLDKDLLGKGRYGPDTAVFLPKALNDAIKASPPGRFKKGTWWDGPKWRAHYASTTIGMFDTEDEAHRAYVEFKELVVKLLAEKYRSTIHPRAFSALMAWTAPC